ncbi:MAG: glycosyltransferase family 4 protein [Trichocoleus desertorum ATA4-8-CV12]|jgi:glycosyltransferase involved in cell wall biosynthesis|nr:glycosyltransferase family 4 protein [Trichocoleus desertorum ATA4-8-CV12]
MKILIYSPYFYPRIGGLETVVSILAYELVAQGHEVKLVSQTPTKDIKDFPFEVIRKPNLKNLLYLTSWCDIFFQGCISLKGIFPLLMVPKPLFVTHQTWYLRSNGRPGWQDYLKQFVTHFATNISASSAVAAHLSATSTVIPNPYQEETFYLIPEIIRDRELIFLGRLVPDKGVDLLLEALSQLKAKGLTPSLTIVGNGPEESKLRQQAIELGIETQVEFVGAKIEIELNRLLNAHQILVVPSRWQEPFGVVALEGIACGCVVVGSEGGGLKDAIGPCGVTFPNSDVKSLTKILADLLNHPGKLSTYRENAKQHLVRHQKAEVAKAYLKVFERALQ